MSGVFACVLEADLLTQAREASVSQLEARAVTSDQSEASVCLIVNSFAVK